MRDMLDSDEPYPLTAWTAQFQRIRTDLDTALRSEQAGRRVAADARAARRTWKARWRSSGTPRIGSSRWRQAARTPRRARRSGCRCRRGRRRSARASRGCSREQRSRRGRRPARVQEIYSQVQRQVYVFLAATFVAIALTSLYLIRSNRRLFARLASLSDQRRELAQQLIATREVHAARDLPRTPRRIRPGADGDGIDARPRRPTHAGGLAAAGRAARDRRDRPDDARQRQGPVAVAPPLDSRGGGARDARSNGIFLRSSGSSVLPYRMSDRRTAARGRRRGRHPGVPRAAGSLEQRRAPFRGASGVGPPAVRAGCPASSKSKTTERLGGAPARRGLGLVAMRERAALVGGTLEFDRPARRRRRSFASKRAGGSLMAR